MKRRIDFLETERILIMTKSLKTKIIASTLSLYRWYDFLDILSR